MNVEGIILAAGFSKRAGTHKMVLEIDGITILERCIEAMYDNCSRVIVVGGYKIENLYPICSKYSKVKLIYNEDFYIGMFNSLKAGLKYIETERFFFTPGDYPFIKNSTYHDMKNFEGEIIVPEFKDLRGHPVLMKSTFINEILYSTTYISLRDFINTKKVTSVSVSDSGILMDIDTMSDYEKLLQLLNKDRIQVT